MKAICPNCQAAYRVDDEKVPDTGAQIKCPKCEHTFIVKRSKPAVPVSSPPTAVPPAKPVTPAKAAFSSSAPPPGEDLFGSLVSAPNTASTDVSQLQSSPTQAKSAASTTPNLDSLSGEAFISASPKEETKTRQVRPARVSSRGVSAIRAQSTTSKLLDGYRVRTASGLTYDFPSEQAMIRWLGDREELDGYQAAEPGGEWIPVEQLLGRPVKEADSSNTTPVVSSPMPPRKASAEKIKRGDNADPSRPIEVERLKPVVPVLPGAPVPGSGATADPYSAAVPSRAGFGLWMGIIVALVLFLAMGSVTLTRYGLVDLSTVLPMEKINRIFPSPEKGAAKEKDDVIDVDLGKIDREAVFSKALAAGRRALALKRFSTAALEFNRARAVHPGSVKALDGLARAFMGLGDVQRAREVMKKAKAIKGR